MRVSSTGGKLALSVSIILAMLFVAWAAIFVYSTSRLDDEALQRRLQGLARFVSASPALRVAPTIEETNIQDLFGQLLVTNPGIELYVLDRTGRIVKHAGSNAPLYRNRVSVEPIRALLSGAALPIYGDDPKAANTKRVFSAAPLLAEMSLDGYIYVVLASSDVNPLTAKHVRENALKNTLIALLLILTGGFVTGCLAYKWVAIPIRRLAALADSHARNGAKENAPIPRQIQRNELVLLGTSIEELGNRAESQLRSSARNDAELRALFAAVTHDLRSPIASVRGHLEALVNNADSISTREARDRLFTVVGQVDRLARLVRELFEVAQDEYDPGPPEIEPIAILDAIQDVVQKLRPLATSRDVHLRAYCRASTPLAMGNAFIVERVLGNLLENAICNSPPGRDVTVDVESSGSHLDIFVTDRGLGIPTEMVAGLFDRPLFKFRGSGGLGGFGLVVVRRLLRSLGSDIELVETGPYGTKFRFRLDVAGLPKSKADRQFK